jgi:HlyD family secretion protein
LVKGEGPLELARLEGGMLEAKQKYEETKSYVGELVKLAQRGYSNPTEVSQATAREEENRKKFESARLQFESYRDYILPAQLETARARVERAQMVLEQTDKSAGFAIGKAIASRKKAEGALESVRASLEIARQELEKTTLPAPISGIVVLREEFRNGEERKPMVGDTVWQNQPLLYLPDLSSMIVKTLVREVDLYKVEKGLPVRVRVDAYPDTALTGRVESIGILAEKRRELQSGEQYFQVVIALDGSDERLRPGMTARTEIISDEVRDALTVPLAALFEAAGRIICYVDVRHSFEVREVVVGRQNDDRTEIREGLEEGEDVCLYPPSAEGIKK